MNNRHSTTGSTSVSVVVIIVAAILLAALVGGGATFWFLLSSARPMDAPTVTIDDVKSDPVRHVIHNGTVIDIGVVSDGQAMSISSPPAGAKKPFLVVARRGETRINVLELSEPQTVEILQDEDDIEIRFVQSDLTIGWNPDHVTVNGIGHVLFDDVSAYDLHADGRFTARRSQPRAPDAQTEQRQTQ